MRENVNLTTSDKQDSGQKNMAQSFIQGKSFNRTLNQGKGFIADLNTSNTSYKRKINPFFKG